MPASGVSSPRLAPKADRPDGYDNFSLVKPFRRVATYGHAKRSAS